MARPGEIVVPGPFLLNEREIRAVRNMMAEGWGLHIVALATGHQSRDIDYSLWCWIGE